MADSSESSKSGLMLPTLAIASLVTTFWVQREEVWTLTRPNVGASASPEGGEQESRLWHDPLDQRKVYRRDYVAGPAKADKALLIAVPATQTPEDVELRIRTRYALHSAMTATGYRPADATVMRELRIAAQPWWQLPLSATARIRTSASELPATWSNSEAASVDGPFRRQGDRGGSGARNTDDALPPLRVEEFRGASGQRILAVWLPEEPLQVRYGMGWASQMVSAIGKLAVESTLIGPSNTHALEGTDLSGIEVRSPWVTARPLVEGPKRLDLCPTETSRSLICLDSKLAETLARELELRGIDPDPKKVLLILERDSTYSRSWLDHMRAQGYAATDSQTAWYSRGLDGDGGSSAGNSSNSSNRGGDSGDERARIERPTGLGTLDYLRRLRQAFHDRSGGIQGVGIFGQDIHDKLLIIQALRPAFPEALFFTTDLDAYYAHPSQLHYTRNLLVASGHGLQPPPMDHAHEEHDGHHPRQEIAAPFRDSYQTSAYHAFHEAICGEPVTVPEAGKVFEIGTNGPVDLQAPVAFWPWLCDGILTLLALFSVLLTGGVVHRLLMGKGLRRSGEELLKSHRLWHLGILWVCLLATAVLFASLFGPEPAIWTAGVSIWPTEILRLLALTLALVFAYHVVRILGRNELRPPDDESEPPSREPLAWIIVHTIWQTVRGLAARLKHAGLAIASHVVGRRSTAPATAQATPPPTRDPATRQARTWRDAAEAWIDASPARRPAVSAFALAVLLFAFGLVLMNTLGSPHVPARGIWIARLDRVLTLSTVLAMLWLVFLVSEAARRFVVICDDQMRILPKTADDWSARRRFLANLADAGGQGIYGPFIVLLILVASRWHGFDDWTWPAALQIMIAVAVGCVLLSHIWLHKAVTAARNASVRQLRAAREQAAGPLESERMKSILEDLGRLDRGIFAGPANHPVMRALVIPFTGIGGLSLLQWLQST